MNLQNHELEGNTLNMIFQLIRNMEAPVSTLIEESNKINGLELSEAGDHDSKNIIFNNSLEIKEMIDQVLKQIRSEKIAEQPLIFEIYRSNERVQCMCKEQIDPNRISKTDKTWLIDLEKEVFNNIDRREIHLGDLSFNLAVSKRQLNRKIHNLLHLTPNKYIRILKLHKARQLIDNFIYDTISQVSYAVGYYDTHYFSKLFGQQYGVTPKQLLVAKR